MTTIAGEVDNSKIVVVGPMMQYLQAKGNFVLGC
jgi:hypothetical protein